MLIQNVLEPIIVKEQIFNLLLKAACMILRVDDVIASSKSKTPPMPPGAGAGTGGMGME